VEFGEFAGEDGGAWAEDGIDVEEGIEDAVRGLIEDESGWGFGPGFEGFAALALFGREEAAEDEGIGREGGGAESGEKGGGAGDGDDGNAFGGGGGGETKAGIGDEGCTGVGDEGDAFTGAEGGEEFLDAFAFIVIVVGDEGFGDVVVIEEFSAVAGILAGDPVDLVLEDAESAEGDVFEVSDGCGDKIKCGRQYS
jgi:hypothetical protein